MQLKAVAFDLIGTLIHVLPQRELMIKSLKETLERQGFILDEFDATYEETSSAHRRIRQEELKEVNNCTSVTQTLQKLGYPTPKNTVLCDSVEAYFRPYLESVMTLDGTERALAELAPKYSLGVVTNFTCSNVVRRSLEKADLVEFFDHIVVSCEVGWRKPHPEIFKRYLKKARVKAGAAAFVGDDPRRDVQGARNMGMAAILLAQELTPTEDYYYKTDQEPSASGAVRPDYTINSLTELPPTLEKIQSRSHR